MLREQQKENKTTTIMHQKQNIDPESLYKEIDEQNTHSTTENNNQYKKIWKFLSITLFIIIIFIIVGITIHLFFTFCTKRKSVLNRQHHHNEQSLHHDVINTQEPSQSVVDNQPLLPQDSLFDESTKSVETKILPFEQWNSFKHIEDWIQHYQQTHGTIPGKNSDGKGKGCKGKGGGKGSGHTVLPEVQVIDISGENKYFYIPPQFEKYQMRESVLKHWFNNKPPNLKNDQDYPINHNHDNPSIFWNGRQQNPFTSVKQYRNDLKYWTDDGPNGNGNHLWTAIFHDKNMNGMNGDLYWATQYSFQEYFHQYDHQSNEYMMNKDVMYGYIVVYQADKPVTVEDYSAHNDVPLRKDRVLGRTGYINTVDDIPDAYVFSAESQKHFGLHVLRVYVMDYSNITPDAWGRSYADNTKLWIKCAMWNKLLCDEGLQYYSDKWKRNDYF